MSTFFFAAALGSAILLCAITIEQLRLRRHRGGTRDEFIRCFDGSGIPYAIPETVYDYYKSCALSRKFGIVPDDAYEETLRKGEEEIDSDARFLLDQLGLRMPPNEILVERNARLRTLRDMVIWLDWARTHQPGDVRL
jgi:hypothetical protein